VRFSAPIGTLATAAVIALGFAGCGGDDSNDSVDQQRCLALCHEQADCENAPVPGELCGAVCGANGTSTKTAGCETEYDALLDCTEALADKCETTNACGPGPGLEWNGCVQRYCQAHPGENFCAQ
jgi:hypothetical protein